MKEESSHLKGQVINNITKGCFLVTCLTYTAAVGGFFSADCRESNLKPNIPESRGFSKPGKVTTETAKPEIIGFADNPLNFEFIETLHTLNIESSALSSVHKTSASIRGPPKA